MLLDSLDWIKSLAHITKPIKLINKIVFEIPSLIKVQLKSLCIIKQ